MSVCSMGTLSILPPELRLIIWDHLFYRQHADPKTHRLAILRTNQALYHEVSSALYDNMQLDISVDPTQNLVMATISSKKLNQSWELGYLTAAWDVFDRLPWHRVHLKVSLSAPTYLSSLGRLQYTVDTIIHLLDQAKYTKSLEIIFKGDWKFGKWCFPMEELFRYQLHAHEIVFLPFYRLKRVQSLKVRLGFVNADRVCPVFIAQVCRLIMEMPLLTHDGLHWGIAKRLVHLGGVMADENVSSDGIMKNGGLELDIS